MKELKLKFTSKEGEAFISATDMKRLVSSCIPRLYTLEARTLMLALNEVLTEAEDKHAREEYLSRLQQDHRRQVHGVREIT